MDHKFDYDNIAFNCRANIKTSHLKEVCLKSMVSREKEIFGDKFLGVALEKDAEM
jgi:hypothetical protein